MPAPVAAFALMIAAACGGDGDSAAVVRLDGSPRVPDVQGVVDKASRDGITLNGSRRYAVSPELVAFSTYNRQPVKLAATIGNYVQIGLRDDEVQWLALIGVVMTDAAGHKTVSYQGELVAVRGRRLDFADGTVLTLAPDLTAPGDALGLTYAAIDADRGLVQGATFGGPAATTTTRTETP